MQFLVFGTHPEYWTSKMYDNVKLFHSAGQGTNGGNILSLGGNSIYERVELNSNHQMVCYNGINNTSRFLFLFDALNNGARSTGKLIGLTSGEQNSAGKPYRIIETAHTLFNNVTTCQDNFFLTKDTSLQGVIFTNGIGCESINIGNDAPGGQNISTGAVGWETDSLAPNDFGNDLTLLATSVGDNIKPSADMIFVKNKSGIGHHGFLFSSGSIYFGGSMVSDNGIDQLMHNVMDFDNNAIKASDIVSNNWGNIYITNKTFYIQNHLEIDNNIEFINCQFYFSPSSYVTINAGKQGKFKNSSLQSGCNQMWQGINLTDNSSKLVLENNIPIRDMEQGILIFNNAQAEIYSNTFTDNNENIRISGNSNTNNIQITANTFNHVGNLLPPHVGEKPLHGIYIENSSEVNIGSVNNTSSGNHFESIENGVTTNIHTSIGPAPLYLLQIYPNAKIQLFNNTFKNIQSTVNLADEKGVGIYATREDPFNVLQVDVWTAPSAIAQSFENCGIGIRHRRASGKIQNQKIKDCGIGMLASEVDGQKMKIQNNTIQNTTWGILKSGDEATLGFTATGNNITLKEDNGGWLMPFGIFSAYSSSTHVGSSNIQNNTVNMPLGNRGLGITLSKGLNDVIGNNQIHMTTPNTDLDVALPKMVGIFANQSEGVNLSGNTINAGTGNSQYIKTNNAGIRIDACKESRLACNAMNFTKYGIFAVGANGSTTNYDKTVGNYMNNSDANVLLWKLTNEGSLGQVGKEISTTPLNVYDGNNDYEPVSGTLALNHVFRITDCLQTFNDEIVTTATKLDQTKSSASDLSPFDCEATVTNPPAITQTFSCTSGGGGGIYANPLSPEQRLDVNYAIAVANNSVEYSEYIEGARRLDEEMVMNWLYASADARAENPILDAYYLARNATVIGQVNTIDRQISLLNDSTLRTDTAAWMSAYHAAHALNNALGTTEVFEQNAKRMNKMYLNTLLHGSEILTEGDDAEIELLAFTCPYTGGNAVFRARVLYGMKHFGVYYDDLEICNGQGVFKNGISKLQEQLNQLSNSKTSDQKSIKVISEEEVYIYPNPTNDYAIIGCKNAMQIIVYDMIGNAVRKVNLNNKQSENRIDVSQLKAGIYIYKIINKDNNVYNGKLIIE